jgi:uncharacterized protein YpbB
VKEMDSLKILARQRLVLALRCKGLTMRQIAARLKDDGWKVSQRTVWKDLHSKTVEDFTEELLRKQLADIATCPDSHLQLNATRKPTSQETFSPCKAFVLPSLKL